MRSFAGAFKDHFFHHLGHGFNRVFVQNPLPFVFVVKTGVERIAFAGVNFGDRIGPGGIPAVGNRGIGHRHIQHPDRRTAEHHCRGVVDRG